MLMYNVVMESSTAKPPDVRRVQLKANMITPASLPAGSNHKLSLERNRVPERDTRLSLRKVAFVAPPRGLSAALRGVAEPPGQ